MVAVSHAPYLINLAGTDPLDRRALGGGARAIPAHDARLRGLAVIVHLGSHLGEWLRRGPRARGARARARARAGRRRHLAAAREHRRRGRDDGPHGRGAGARDRPLRHAPLARRLHRQLPPLRLRRRRRRRRPRSTPRSTSSTPAIGLDRLKALHINDSQMPLGSNRDRHASVGEGLIGERLSVFLGRPRLQGLPAVLETLGTTARAARTTCASSSASGAWASAADVRVAVVDPQAYTLPYDDELCRALAAAGAEVELLTAHFTHGAAPVAARLRAPRALRPAARRPARAPARPRPCACRSSSAGTPSGSPGSSAACAPGTPTSCTGSGRPLPVARPAGAARRRARAPARRCSRRTTCCRAARATRRRCGPSCTASCDRVIVHGAASRDRLLVEVGGIAPERIAVIPHALLHAGAGADAAARAGRAAHPLLRPDPPRQGPRRPDRGAARSRRARARRAARRRRQPAHADRAAARAGRGARRRPSGSAGICASCPTPRCPRCSRRARVVALPYRWIEGSGVLATALARGVPPVVTAVGTFPELCAEYDLGDPVPPDDPAALARRARARADRPRRAGARRRGHGSAPARS